MRWEILRGKIWQQKKHGYFCFDSATRKKYGTNCDNWSSPIFRVKIPKIFELPPPRRLFIMPPLVTAGEDWLKGAVTGFNFLQNFFFGITLGRCVAKPRSISMKHRSLETHMCTSTPIYPSCQRVKERSPLLLPGVFWWPTKLARTYHFLEHSSPFLATLHCC